MSKTQHHQHSVDVILIASLVTTQLRTKHCRSLVTTHGSHNNGLHTSFTSQDPSILCVGVCTVQAANEGGNGENAVDKEGGRALTAQ